MDSLQDKAYWIVGVGVVMNLGAIGAMLFASFKVVWFFSKLESRIERVEERTNDDGPIYKDINNAHAAIREIRRTL